MPDKSAFLEKTDAYAYDTFAVNLITSSINAEMEKYRKMDRNGEKFEEGAKIMRERLFFLLCGIIGINENKAKEIWLSTRDPNIHMMLLGEHMRKAKMTPAVERFVSYGKLALMRKFK